jgi:hypothetical protein
VRGRVRLIKKKLLKEMVMDGMKSRQLKIALCGIAALGLFAATQGCSSSTSSSGTGGAGGGGSGTGGKTGGSGGSTTSGAGGSTTSGAGGGGGQHGCTTANTMTAPTSGLIADFMGDGSAGVEIMGGVATYSGTAAPTATTNGTTLHIAESAAAMSMPQYVGTVLYFSDCIDASAFTGVQFAISGTMTGCTMQFSINDSEHGDSTQVGGDPKASGPMGSYSPQLGVATPFTATMMVPFAGTGAPTGGSPAATAIDPAKLTGVQWQFTIAAAAGDGGAGSCTADITIDDVKFYH